ncbi:MAG: PIN domain-containing protein [Candidatus Dormibacteraeota bacterium]|nr:PIN domain-containing protein [Candidatus Dormibacteraeota bacterium]
MIGRALIDNSAWARLESRLLDQSRAAEVIEAVRREELHVSLPFLLEAGYSAQSGPRHRDLFNDLLKFPWAAIDHGVERRALEAQRQLAVVGHHRMPAVDLIIAALADRHGLGVLHYDRDFDVIAEKTDLRFTSEWLAPAGSLGEDSAIVAARAKREEGECGLGRSCNF